MKDTISAVLLFWNKAQIPQITQIGCQTKLKTLVKEWEGFMKSKTNKQTKQTVLQKREKYGVFLDTLFDVSARDWEQKIISSRNSDAAKEDIEWLNKIKRDEKTGVLAGVDMNHKHILLHREERFNKEMKRKMKEEM